MGVHIQSAVKYSIATVGLCLLALFGLWLPWVAQKPRYYDGDPYINAIGLPGIQRGFVGTIDFVALFGLVPAIAGILILQRWKWLRDACVFLTGILICWLVGDLLYEYWSVDHYLVKPGIVVVLVSGLLLCILSGGAFLRRLISHPKASQPTA